LKAKHPIETRAGSHSCGQICARPMPAIIAMRRLVPAVSLGLASVPVFVAAQSAEEGVPCVDDGQCASWVSRDDPSNCSHFPGLLRLHCPVACGACEAHEHFRRCSIESGGAINEPAAVGRLAPSARALSSLVVSAADAITKEHEGRGLETKLLRRDGPFLMQMEAFLSPVEAGDLIGAAEEAGFQRGDQYIDGAAELRTSATTFCRGACQWSPSVVALTERISTYLGVPVSHFEPVQFVRYGPGERYAEHNDFIAEDVEQPCGARLFTFFVYLSDGFGGGETAFPHIGVQIVPAVGRAAFWSNSMVYVGGKSGKMRWLPDGKASHEALPVAEGPLNSQVKYAANIWVHDGDVRHTDLYRKSCAALGMLGHTDL